MKVVSQIFCRGEMPKTVALLILTSLLTANYVTVFSGSAMAETPLHAGNQLSDASFQAIQRSAKRYLKRVHRRQMAACQNNNGHACYSLGEAANEKAHPLPKRAYRYFKKACDAGYAEGCNEQGKMLLNFEHSVNRRNLAMSRLTRGCKLQPADACKLISDLLKERRLNPELLTVAHPNYQTSQETPKR